MDLKGFKKLTPSQNIAVSFLIVIVFGAFLLMTPIANTDGEWHNILNALFTSTSATCVTGLTVSVTAEQYTFFGQLVIMLLIQIGGLGLMTLVATFLIVMKTKLSVQNKIALKEMLNQTSFSNMKSFIVGICRYTLFFESIGFIILAFVFVPEKGFIDGLWNALFTSVSAFCNAGFDIIGSHSLAPYLTNPIVNWTIMGLIVCGGLGFAVWFECKDKIVKILKREMSFRKAKHSLTLHSKLVILSTLIMMILPAILILLVEWDNPATIGKLNVWEKIQASMFESITFRTAGFATFDNGLMEPATKFLGMLCMFVGGSPGGTAGGVKTTTVAVILACVICRLRNYDRTDVYGRHISRQIIVQATMIILANILVLFTGIFVLSIFEPFDFNQICFEATSALATVGLTTGITSQLSVLGKIVIILLMYIGRIGIMTVLISLTNRRKSSDKKCLVLPEGHVMVG